MSLTIEAGKPIKDSRGEVTRLIDTFIIAMEESTRIYGASSLSGIPCPSQYNLRPNINMVGCSYHFHQYFSSQIEQYIVIASAASLMQYEPEYGVRRCRAVGKDRVATDLTCQW